MKKRFFKKIGLVLATLLIPVIFAFTFIAGGAIHSVQAAAVQQWDYGILVYASEDGSITWVEADPDRMENMQTTMESLTKNSKTKIIPYVYYASLAGRFGWELILERDEGSVTALTFKRPFDE